MVAVAVQEASEEASDEAGSRGDEPDGEEAMLVDGELAATCSARQSAAMVNQQLQAAHSLEEEEQLRRILQCKRLSEGCNRFNAAAYLARKNSLHLVEEMPPLTEGEPMAQSAMGPATALRETGGGSSSASSGSLRSITAANGQQRAHREMSSLKRGSQDDPTNSCSSSTSLSDRSPTSGSSRRRSSTVSQCSSVLSESARNQLNFDLSPDLPPDSSLLEANALSPGEIFSASPAELEERPQSPEPTDGSRSSLSSPSLELRPVSRMSQCLDELMLSSSSVAMAPSAFGGNIASHEDIISAAGDHSNTSSPANNENPFEQRFAALTQPASARIAGQLTANLEAATATTSVKRALTPALAKHPTQQHTQQQRPASNPNQNQSSPSPTSPRTRQHQSQRTHSSTGQQHIATRV